MLLKLGCGGGSRGGGGGGSGSIGGSFAAEGLDVCLCDFAQIEIGSSSRDTSFVAHVHVLVEIEDGILEALLLCGGCGAALRLCTLHLSLE